tara:strand:- start:143264 stop:144268 length:1005 start_codon:yes stop_codon:yes gene_type:complete
MFQELTKQGSLSFFLNKDMDPDQKIEEVTLLKDGTKVNHLYPGIFIINPPLESDESIAISCGIHGNETAPIEITTTFLDDILNNKVEAKVNLLIIIGNLYSMKLQKREVYFNLNRMFSETHKQHSQNEWETKRAMTIESAFHAFFAHSNHEKWHFDLHTAIRKSKIKRFAVAPVKTEQYSTDELNVLKNFGIEAIVYMQSKATTLSYYTHSYFNSNSFTLELGKVEPFGENILSEFHKAKNAIYQVATRGIESLKSSTEDIKEFLVKKELIKDSQNYTLNFPDDFPNFSKFERNFQVYTSDNSEYRTTEDEFIAFPNQNVPIGQRTALILINKS